jgi:hypothetical protein
MPKLDLNIDDMYFAISNAEAEAGLPAWIGHLNRKSGRLVFVSENEGECDKYLGPNVAAESAASRAEVAASPDEWVQVPKYRDDRDPDAFIATFLTQHEIEPNFYMVDFNGHRAAWTVQDGPVTA